MNAQNSKGDTPLHRTTPWNNLTVARLLVENGADITIENEEGLTPLEKAKEERARGIVKYLKKLK